MYSATEVNTCTCISDFNSRINIEVIFNYLEIDDYIVGTKYLSNTKGDISKNKSFSNQVTVIIYSEKHSKRINLKIFGNGRIQVTGIKSKEQAKHAINLLFLKIIKIYNISEIDVIYKNGMLLNRQEFKKFVGDIDNRVKIYGSNKDDVYREIGIIHKNNIYVNGVLVELVPELDCFMDKKHTNKTKKCYDKNGVYIGICEYNLSVKRKNLRTAFYNYEKVSDFHYKINNNKGEYIGDKIYRFNDKITHILKKRKIKNIEKCFLSDDYKIPDLEDIMFSNINSNFILDIKENEILDKLKVFTYISEYNNNIKAFYNPLFSNKSVNIRIYYDTDYTLTTSKKYKYRVTMLIFGTGNIVISGCTNFEIIDISKKEILKFIKLYRDKIILKPIQKSLKIEKNISILDII